MKTINFSVIIPHRDIPSLLRRCIYSIPNREDLEVLIIDDNSSPTIFNKLNLLKNAKKNIRIIFSKEGKGAGYARNLGLKQARGKWLIFADADDFFHENCFNVFSEFIDSENDIIYFNADSVESNTLQRIPFRQACYKKELLNHDLLALRYHSFVPWAKMIRREMVEKYHLKFDEVMASNDVMFSAACGHYAQKVDICLKEVYCCTKRSDSLWFSKQRSHLLCRIKVATAFNKKIHKLKLERFRFYTFQFVHDSRKYGEKAFLKALETYLFHEKMCYIYQDFSKMIKAKISKRRK